MLNVQQGLFLLRQGGYEVNKRAETGYGVCLRELPATFWLGLDVNLVASFTKRVQAVDIAPLYGADSLRALNGFGKRKPPKFPLASPPFLAMRDLPRRFSRIRSSSSTTEPVATRE